MVAPRPEGPLRWNTRAALALVGALYACSTFTSIPARTCGNGVLEGDDEDCDPFVQNPKECRPPGSSDACRFPCDAANACPSGMTCVLGRGACVRPAGSFSSAARLVDGVSATNIDLVDTDGDGSTETFVGYDARDATRAYFDFPSNRDTASLRVRRIPEWPVPPRGSRALDADRTSATGARAVFAPVATGVTMLRRQLTGDVEPDARFGLLLAQSLPIGFQREGARAFSLRRTIGRKGSVRDAAALVSAREGGVLVGVTWVAPAETDVSSCASLQGGFARTIADHALSEIVFAGGANVAEGSPCDEFVIVFRDGDVRIFESCTAAACALPSAGVIERRARLEPPPDGIELTEAVAADVDGDGHVDLLGAWRRGPKATASGRLKAFSIAPGFGAGSFPLSIPFLVDVANGARLFESDEGLAVFRERRDVDGKESGRTFAVIADRVLRFDGDLEETEPPGPFRIVTAQQVTWPTGAARWEDPSTADLDGDGVVDVVLRSGSRLIVLRGNGLGAFGSSVVEATTTIRAKTVGDFDGDGLLDVAIGRDFFTNTSAVPLTIEVAYGAGATRFGAWVRTITATNAAASLLPLRLPAFNGADSLVVRAPDRGLDGPEFVSLVGDGTQAGLFPSASVRCGGAVGSGGRIFARTGTLAHLVTSNGAGRDVLFLGGEASVAGDGSPRAFDGFATSEVSGSRVDLTSVDCQRLPANAVALHAAAANLCGDASDEVVVISVEGNAAARVSLATFALRGSSLATEFVPLRVASRVDGSALKPSNVIVLPEDLDGDGDLDVVLRLGDEVGVLWNEQRSPATCDASAFVYEALPLGSPSGREPVIGVAALNRGDRVPMSLLVLTRSAEASLLRFDLAAGRAFTSSRLGLPEDQTIQSLGAPTAIGVGDVDGDGLDDIVLADRRGIRVHYGIEAPRRRR